MLSGYARQIKGLHSLSQPTTQALVSLVNHLPRLDLMEPVFGYCPSDDRLRRTLIECLAGSRDAGVLLRRHPSVVARAAGAAIRKVVGEPDNPDLAVKRRHARTGPAEHESR